MSIVKKFNGLNGAIVTRKAAEKLLKEAKNQEQTELAERLAKVLKDNPKEKRFTFKIEDPAIERLPQSMLAGFQLDELNEETGLNAVSQQEIYDKVTKMILNTIKKVGHLPWQKDWAGSGGGNNAMNYVSGKAYTGINFLMLNFDQLIDEDGEPYLVPVNFIQPYYLTFKQIEKAGAKLKKGSKARNVFYYTPIFVYNHNGVSIRTSDKAKFNEQVKQHGVSDDDVKRYAGKIPVVKYYNVYRADDCTGLTFPERPKQVIEPIEAAQAIIDHYPDPPRFTFGGDDAVFYPLSDTVNMPVIKSFDTPQGYYCTFFHEIVHSTGHKKRLDRGLGKKPTPKEYAFEELIAELGAVYLCGQSGILFSTKDNSAKYLSYWVKQLQKQLEEDNKFFFRAAAAAQKAADHILDLNVDDVPAYLVEAVKAMKPEKKKKPVQKTVAKKVATKKDKANAGKRAEVVGFAIVDNINGSIVASKKTLQDLHEVYKSLEVKQYTDLPVLVYEIIKVRTKNKLGQAIDVDWKRKEINVHFPSATRKRKKTDPQQLTLGLQGKRKPVENQGLNAIYTEKQFEDTVKELKENPAPAEPVAVPEPTPAPIKKKNPLVLSSEELMSMHFETLPMDEEWSEFMQEPAKNMKIAIYGKPKNGKTSGATQLASYLTKFGDVLYNFVDQGFNKSTQQIWQNAGLDKNPKAHAAAVNELDELEKLIASGDYQFIFIDMINNYIDKYKMKPHEFKERFIMKYPDISFILVFEVTKSGNFKGDQGWTHIVDAIVTVEDFLMENRGRYGVGHHVVWLKGFKDFNPKKYAELYPKEDKTEPPQSEPEPAPVAPGLNAPAVPLQFTVT